MINEKDLEKNVGTNFIDSKSWLDWLRKIYPIDQLILEFQEKIDIENGPEINIVKGLVPGFKSTLCKLFADLKPI